MSNRILEDTEYVAMLRRMIRAAGRRFANSDPDGLALFCSLKDELEAELSNAALQLSATYSWSEIARPLGVSKQAVFKKYSSSRVHGEKAPELRKHEQAGAV